MEKLREDAHKIIEDSIKAVMPDAAVKEALKKKNFQKRNIYIVAIGKAAWHMAKASYDVLGDKIVKGLVVTKYQHSQGEIPHFSIVEAGHPIPDENSVLGATLALEMASTLTADDQLLFLISGGGSALFEKPAENVSLNAIMAITSQLLSCGADIVAINTVRKHLSAVKGGRFAEQCKANIYAIVLSDVVGDRLDAIASGPAYPDTSTSKEALEIIKKYDIAVDASVLKAIENETPKHLDHVETSVSGSVRALCEAAATSAKALGYQPFILSTSLDCEAKEAGKFLASIARQIADGTQNSFFKRPCAVIVGGETVVHLIGNGKGGRNQEMALSAAIGIEELENVVLFSVGSDGTDGPTDAAGGLVDGNSIKRMRQSGRIPEAELDDNNAYNALLASGDLIITGATGTNVNDLSVILIR